MPVHLLIFERAFIVSRAAIFRAENFYNQTLWFGTIRHQYTTDRTDERGKFK